MERASEFAPKLVDDAKLCVMEKTNGEETQVSPREERDRTDAIRGCGQR